MRILTMSAVRLALCLVVGLAAPATAQNLSTKSNMGLTKNQLRVLDGRAAQQYNSSVRLQPPPLHIPGVPLPKNALPITPGPYLDIARSAARRHNVPEDIFLRLVMQESAWNPHAVSHKGAIGLAQLMPMTARKLGVDPRDPAQNLEGGARYLRAQFDTFGSWRLALAAYNAGPGAVQKYDGIPPYRETQNYVVAILGR